LQIPEGGNAYERELENAALFGQKPSGFFNQSSSFIPSTENGIKLQSNS